MSTIVPEEPRTAKQERSQQVGQADPLPNSPETAHGGDGGGSGRIPPEPPPTTHGRGDGRPSKPSRWARLMLYAIFALLTFLSGFLLAKAWLHLDKRIWGS